MSSFVGAPLLAAAALLLARDEDGGTIALLVGALVLALATVVITAAVHLPLNKQIQEADLDQGADPAVARARFERRWVRFNIVRTVTSVGAFVVLTVVLAR